MSDENTDDYDDPLGDLGDLDDFASDDETDEFTMTNRPMRTAEKICFVPVDPFKTMDNVPSNVIPEDQIEKPHQSIHPSSPSQQIDKQNKNIKFTKMDDEGNDTHSNTATMLQYDIYNTPGQINLDDSYSDSSDFEESSYESYTDSDEDKPSNNVTFTDDSVKRRSIDHGSDEKLQHTFQRLKRGQSDRNIALRKYVSDFRPKEFDILLLHSSPLTIKTKNTQNVKRNNKSHRMSRAYQYTPGTYLSTKLDRMNLLDYIRNNLPDRLELQQTVRQTLVRRNISLRYGHFTLTRESITQLNTFGGCKVLQIVAYCINPKKDKKLYPELCKSLLENHMNKDTNYILLETEVGHQSDYDDEGICCFGKGIWYSMDDLSKLLNASMTQIDCIIAMSPQHERLTKVFKTLGYDNVIGVEAPDNNNYFSTTETAAFLDQLYAALLERRSVSRAYYLSLQAALTSRGSVRGGNDNDPKYILAVTKPNDFERFIPFAPDELKVGEIEDKSQNEKLPKTNLREPVRPFIGRSEYVIELLKKLTDTQIVNVPGKELIGRASVVKSTTRYLLQMGFFRGGCFVIDCKLQSKKFRNNKSKTFNECVYDVLKSCGVDFHTQPDDMMDEDDDINIPQMNHTYDESNLTTLTAPSLIGHYSQRSSTQFPKMSLAQIHNDSEEETEEMREHIPVINKEFGDPKHSPRSLFEYLDNSIFYDQKPPSHEPFCFVILNMNHWHNGGDKVTEWISKFSQQLFKKEDSRIICTGTNTLNIHNVSTLNMKSLSPFRRQTLAKLFKYFCLDFQRKFNPSTKEIEKHKALQAIFDGRPGMTKKVSMYVRYLFARNDMKEIDEENDHKNESLNDDITLNYIAQNYPKSTYAVLLSNSNTNLHKKPKAPPSQQDLFKAGSASVPSELSKQYRNSSIDDSNIHLNTEGHLSLNDMHHYSSGNSSTPKSERENQQFFHDPSDPSVLIPDQPINAKSIKIYPPGGINAGGSPPVTSVKRKSQYRNGYPSIPYQQQQSSPQMMQQMQSYPQYYNQQQFIQQQQQQQQQQQAYIQQQHNVQVQMPYQYQNQQNMSGFYQYSMNGMPSSMIFQNNHAGMRAAMGASSSDTQLMYNARENRSVSNIPPPPPAPAPAPAQTQTQSIQIRTTSIVRIPTPNQYRYNQSIETLKNKQKQTHKNGTQGHTGEVHDLFNQNGTTQTTQQQIQTNINRSQKIPLNPKPPPNKQSITLMISDPNHNLRAFSIHEQNGKSTADNLMPQHRLRDLNRSIDNTATQPIKPTPINWNNKPIDDGKDNYHISVDSQMVITAPNGIIFRQGSTCINNGRRRSLSVDGGISVSRSASVVEKRLSLTSTSLYNISRRNTLSSTPDINVIPTNGTQLPSNGTQLEANQSITLLSNIIQPGHSLQFSTLTEVSVLNEQTSVECSNATPSFEKKNSNPSFFMSPAPSVTEGVMQQSMDLGARAMVDVQSAPLAYDANKLTKNNTKYEKMAMTDCAIIGISHSYSARKMWLNSCLASNNNIARLHDLFPHLMDEFRRLTRCDQRQPTLQQIQLFFMRTGGMYETNIALPAIKADKFDKFFAWFRSMCSIIRDLRPMYNRAEDPLIGLFYGRTTAQEILEHKPEGTFILRLASQQNGLAITYKNPTGNIQNVLLTRISNEMYRVGKSDKETMLFSLIRQWQKLRYLYTPSNLIRKKFLF